MSSVSYRAYQEPDPERALRQLPVKDTPISSSVDIQSTNEQSSRPRMQRVYQISAKIVNEWIISRQVRKDQSQRTAPLAPTDGCPTSAKFAPRINPNVPDSRYSSRNFGDPICRSIYKAV